MKFAIGIPTLNRLDLLFPSLMMYLHDMPSVHIYIVDNGKQNIFKKIRHPNIKIIESETNLGVASSWNVLCNQILEHYEYALILNDDIYLGKKEYEVELFLSQYPNKDFYLGMIDWSVFIMPSKTFKKVGIFDEQFFPAYYEDNDYMYRMRLMAMKIYNVPFLNPLIHRSSMTNDKDKSIIVQSEANKERYINKWGGLPELEKFKRPYENGLSEISELEKLGRARGKY